MDALMLRGWILAGALLALVGAWAHGHARGIAGERLRQEAALSAARAEALAARADEALAERARLSAESARRMAAQALEDQAYAMPGSGDLCLPLERVRRLSLR
jgi:hypothetical protein